jgi:hypothetical protein
MKKLYNILVCAGLAVAIAFTSCRPLDKTFDGIGPKQSATVPVVVDPTVTTITLTDDDYNFLPAINPAQGTHLFANPSAAIDGIPFILDKKYPDAVDKSQITVNYSLSPTIPPYFKPADSTYSKLTYTIQSNEYAPIDTHGDFSAPEVLQWLTTTKYPTPLDHQVSILTFTYYDGAAQPNTTQGFVYINGVWQKGYLISAAQYASVGRTTNFVTADNSIPLLTSYFNAFLKADPIISIGAKVNDIQYVCYRYNSFLRVLPLVFDGVNWISVAKATDPLVFGKTNGQWSVIYDNSLSYTLTKADYTTIAGISGIASAASVSNLSTHGYANFAIASASSNVTDDGVRWTDVQIANSIIAILKAKYTDVASTNQKFNVTYGVYGGYYAIAPATTAYLTSQFIYDGTDFVYQPVASQTKYTLTGDDITAIARATTGATDAAKINLNQYGDFSSAWTQDNINAGINIVLKTRYTAPTANQTIAVSYPIYNGSGVTVTKNYKFNGTDWALAQ